MNRLASLIVISLLACVLGGCSTPDAAFERDTGNPADALVESKCSLCHTTERVYAADKSAEEWDATVDRMEKSGLVITDAEQQQIVEYLSE